MTIAARLESNEIVDALTSRFPVKAWSFIATILGDLDGDGNSEVPGPILSAITETIGIRPEAMRVALHRLRKDGWISVRKVGRTSLYKLSKDRRAEAQKASDRIFARTVIAPDKVYIVMESEESESKASDSNLALSVYAGVQISLNRPAPDGSKLILEADTDELPLWMRNRFIQESWKQECVALLELVQSVSMSRMSLLKLPEIQQVTMRMLLVHNWRRLVLRLPEQAEPIQPKTWIGQECRHATLDLLEHLPHSILQALIKAEVQTS